MSSNGGTQGQPRRSAKERQMVDKSREEEVLGAPATPKKPKPIRLAQAKLAQKSPTVHGTTRIED